MSATEVLRRMLDERGVEWWQSVNMLGCVFTRWYSPLFSDEVVAMENGDGELELFSHLMTPEQAIAATLGSCNCSDNCTNGERTGTCSITDNGPWGYPYVCSECGASFDPDVNNGDFNYCPNCGRRVEQ